jgi:hypothetical protein
VEFTELLKVPLTEDDQTDEEALEDSVNAFLNAKVEYAKLTAVMEKIGLLHSFLLLKGLLL